MSWFTEARDAVTKYYLGAPAPAQPAQPTSNPPAQSMSQVVGGAVSNVGGMSQNTVLLIGGAILAVIVLIFALKK